MIVPGLDLHTDHQWSATEGVSLFVCFDCRINFEQQPVHPIFTPRK